jgi:signal transduction histidine kinase/ActR/RegA family two-component response regulator
MDRGKRFGLSTAMRPGSWASFAMPSDPAIMAEVLVVPAIILFFLPLIDLVIVGVAVSHFQGYLATPLLLGWAGAFVLVDLARAIYALPFLRGRRRANPYRFHVIMVMLAGLSGAVLGSLGFLGLPSMPPDEQVLLVGLCFGYAAGGACTASSPALEAAYAGGILGMIGLGWTRQHPAAAAAVCVGLAVFLLFLIVVTNLAKTVLVRSILLRRERDRLIQVLEQQNGTIRESLAKVEKSALARARVLAEASHDLRQPLHALSIYSAVLASNPGPAVLTEVVENIDQIVGSLGKLLNGMLDLSKLTVGDFVQERRLHRLDLLLRDICREFEAQAAAKGLRLAQRIERLDLVTDAVAISRIIRNLIDNAIKYTAAGTVLVACGWDEEGAFLTVSDTGRGIPPAEQERIFEEFYQIDQPGQPSGEGVGLGLALVQRLCEAIGARVSVRSGVGEGASFTLRLPQAIQAAALEMAAVPAGAGLEPVEALAGSLAGLTVLVLDDEPDNLRSMNMLMTYWGARVSLAETGEAAAALFATAPRPGVLLTDLRLKRGESGADLARRLLSAHGPFPVIIMTGETATDQLRAANLSDYLVLKKPIAAHDLHRALRRHRPVAVAGAGG